ncbi:PQQ-binding-like beta-propeller repeat protein [Paenibacillus chibensis]|uniref:PQQ-binding-like beta-propeller repeat protein n=1 Tax=Paenibacillus chibensis TaxID=59846 RepID=A0ABU6Q105_9BACL|nr:PQQ-binding-like beta-propeller repeat protein [Paenibacillus chibensis]
MRKTIRILIMLTMIIGLLPGAALAKDKWSIEGAGDITSISISEDGSQLAIGSHGAKASVFSRDGDPVFEFAANNVVTGVQLLNDGQLLVSSDDRHLYAFDAKGGKLWDKNMKSQIKGISASLDGSVAVIFTQRSENLVFIDAANGEEKSKAPVGAILKAVKVSPNGKWIAASSSDQYIHLMDEQGNVVQRFGAGGQIMGISVSDSGETAVGTDKKAVEWFDKDGKQLHRFVTRDVVTDVSFTADGKVLGVSDLSGNFYLLSSKGSRLWETKLSGQGRNVELDLKGQTLYAGTGDGQILKFDVGSIISQAQKQGKVKIGLWAAASLAAVALIWLVLNLMKKRNRLGVFREIWKSKWVYLGLAPTFVLLLTFLYYPAFSGLFHSLYKWQPGARTTFIGLDNFKRMFHDPYVMNGLGNLLILIITGLIKAIIPPLFVAELIYHLRSKRLQYGFRTMFTASMIIPGVAMLLVWQNLYDPNLGLFNKFLELIGLGSWAHAWLGDPETAIWALIFIGFPFIGILQLLVFYAGLLSIPVELIESAKIDGAGLPRIIRSIHLPLLAGQFKFLIILSLIGIVQDFNGILIVTGGGPMDSTYVPALQMYYAATKFNDLGYASALGVSMFVVILIITVINMKFIQSEET